ncbi:MAG: hypothetical protein AABX05_05400, partial [Nanoarchaeota archaeon]
AVKNNWGHRLRYVYAKRSLDGAELLQTPTINLEPWQESELKGLIKVELAPGIYAGKIKLFYENEDKEIPVTIKVLKSEEEKISPEDSFKNNLLISLLVGLVAVLSLVFAYFIYNKNKGHKNGF